MYKKIKVEDVEAGDEVLLRWQSTTKIETVFRVTKTLIILRGNMRYSKLTGKLIGTRSIMDFYISAARKKHSQNFNPTLKKAIKNDR